MATFVDLLVAFIVAQLVLLTSLVLLVFSMANDCKTAGTFEASAEEILGFLWEVIPMEPIFKYFLCGIEKLSLNDL